MSTYVIIETYNTRMHVWLHAFTRNRANIRAHVIIICMTGTHAMRARYYQLLTDVADFCADFV